MSDQKQKKPVKPLRPAGIPPRYEDVVFATVQKADGEDMDLKMDIYQDLNQKEQGPCIIYYFGGGWMYGEYKQVTQRASYFQNLVKLVSEGYTVVSPAYRLTSDAPFPAPIHDCKGVVRFLKANAEKFNIDSERIGTLGNSAGGHLASMVAFSSNCKELEGDVGGNLEFSSSVKAAAIYYPPIDILELIRNAYQEKKVEVDSAETELGTGFNLQEGPELLILGYTGEGQNISKLGKILEENDVNNPDWKYIELAKACTPTTHVHKDCPPSIVLHGGHDPLVPISHSEKLYKSLVDVGAEATYLSYSLAVHGPHVSKEADNYALDFLKREINK